MSDDDPATVERMAEFHDVVGELLAAGWRVEGVTFPDGSVCAQMTTPDGYDITVSRRLSVGYCSGCRPERTVDLDRVAIEIDPEAAALVARLVKGEAERMAELLRDNRTGPLAAVETARFLALVDVLAALAGVVDVLAPCDPLAEQVDAQDQRSDDIDDQARARTGADAPPRQIETDQEG